MKRFGGMLLVILLLLQAVPLQMASAAERTTATVSSAVVRQGEKAKIDVRLSDNPGLAAWTFEVRWDPKQVTLDPESVTVGTGFSNGDLLTNAKEEGKLLLTWYTTSDNKSAGDLFSLELTVREGAEDGVYPIEILCQENNTINIKEETVPVKTVDGTLTVVSSDQPVKPEAPDSKPEEPPEIPEAPSGAEPEQPQAPFSDVAKDMYYYDAVQWAVRERVTTGATATTFVPEGVCTRGQMVTFLWRAAGCPEPMSGVNPFEDIRETDYYSKAVLWAAENKITQGTGAAAFSPELEVTRSQVVTLLWRQNGSEHTDDRTAFTDVDQDAFYTDAVLWAVAHAITAGTSGTTFSPEIPCTRGQIVTFLYRSAVNQEQ